MAHRWATYDIKGCTPRSGICWVLLEKGETSIDTNSTVTLIRHERAVTSTVTYLHEDSKKDEEGWSLHRKETQPREQLELMPALWQDMVIVKIIGLQRLLKKKLKNQKPWRGKELDHDCWAQCFASTTLNVVHIDTPYVTVGSSSQSTVLWGFYWNRSKRWKKGQHMRIQTQSTTLPGDNYCRLPLCSSCPSPRGLGATPTRNCNQGRQCTLKGFT